MKLINNEAEPGLTFTYRLCFLLIAGGFEHVVNLSQLSVLNINGFWAAFEDLPHAIAGNDVELQVKLGYLRDRFVASADPLL